MYTSTFLSALLLASTQAVAEPQHIELKGKISGAQHQSYVAVPFDVPAGTQHIEVSFDYDNSHRTVIDLGLEDPQRFRGWSGGSKKQFSLSELAATPSYLAGPIIAGEWKLILGVPNIRSTSESSYHATITLHSTIPDTQQVIADKRGWYRGDLHAHSGQSDGWCQSKRAQKVACPTEQGLSRAERLQLDFIAFTEHNSRAGFADVARLQPFYDNLLMLPGREITTFYGHANVLGESGFIDFRMTDNDFTAIQKQINNQAITIINHPNLPSGEQCMGCGWQADANYNAVQAIEVANSSTLAKAGGKGLATTLWHQLLDQGYRLSATAGSDNHNPHELFQKWEAITVIEADNLSAEALYRGIRDGRAFIDLQNQGASYLNFNATQGEQQVAMGGVLEYHPQQPLTLMLATDIEGSYWKVITSNATYEIPYTDIPHQLPAGIDSAWLRVELYSEAAEPLLVSSPIYLHSL
ncbi:phosphotransferase [Pseudidiomarina sediminum]|uniref:Phosphotransferase n=1 Tax=Pseudidiomarina sediminum TaxID=431675 RepID=A0A432Z301_9GAMM|nr:CehA/McbA family metallohydrolase [Pseudidiomarina sediminum]RUO72266.1 phosphotransferase [Pseudidiomarina sediminum]